MANSPVSVSFYCYDQAPEISKWKGRKVYLSSRLQRFTSWFLAPLGMVSGESEHHGGVSVLEQKFPSFIFHVYVHVLCMPLCVCVAGLVHTCV